MADALRGTLQVIDDRDVSDGLERLVAQRVRTIPVAPLVGRAIDLAIEGGHQERLLDAVLVGLDGFLDDNRPALRDRLQTESPWWVPEPIDDRIFNKMFTGVQNFLHDVHDNPRARGARRRSTSAWRVRRPPARRPGAAQARRGAEGRAARPPRGARLARPSVGRPQAHHAARHDAPRQRATPADRHARWPSSAERLESDPELQAKVDDWLVGTIGYLVDHYRGEVAELISGTVAKWDGKATSRRLELQVGRDLQFIRINGTIVGGLAGLLIYTVSQLLF